MKLIYFVIIGNGLVRNSVQLLVRPRYKHYFPFEIVCCMVLQTRLFHKWEQTFVP